MKNKLYFAGNPDLPGRPTLALSSSGRMTRSAAIDKSITAAAGMMIIMVSGLVFIVGKLLFGISVLLSGNRYNLPLRMQAQRINNRIRSNDPYDG
jgi:hypothetical protein